MKITSIEVWPISMPYRVPWRNRHTEERGEPMTHLETSILQVCTDEGIIGLGEAKGPDVATAAEREFEPLLRGRDPFQIAAIVSSGCTVRRG